MSTVVTVEIADCPDNDQQIMAPVGMATPYQMPEAFSVEGASFSLIGEASTGQMAALITPRHDERVTLRYVYGDTGSAYPDMMFHHRPNRFTSAADDLMRDARRIADQAGDGHDAIETIVNDVATKFFYGHPETRFNEGEAVVPFLACGLTEGSCVDINTYLIAALRAAGFEAGYATGYFFPAEKNGHCDDMHCWVVTRHQGVVLEWDIAHHMKLGQSEICCGLNPKPGIRVALAHSMGLTFPALGIKGMKLLAEPIWVDSQGGWKRPDLAISMRIEAI